MAKMTEAFKKADAKRDSFFKNIEGLVKIQPEGLNYTVYKFEKNGVPVYYGYKGRSLKAVDAYRYRDAAQRDEAIVKFEARMNEYYPAASAKPAIERALKVGDVLKASWGYDQTNIDYFKVVRLVGKISVEVVEIAGKLVKNDSCGYNHTVPNLDEVIGKPFTKREGNYGDAPYIRLNSFSSARLKKPLVDGSYSSDMSDSIYTGR